MTSNMGSDIIQENFDNYKGDIASLTKTTKKDVLGVLKQRVRPEFINRIDDIVMFTPLNEEEIKQIVSLQFKGITKLLEAQGIVIDATEQAIELLAKKGYDPQYGARPVKRVIQKEVLNELSKQLLSSKISTDSVVLVDAFENKLVFRNQTKTVSF